MAGEVAVTVDAPVRERGVEVPAVRAATIRTVLLTRPDIEDRFRKTILACFITIVG